MAKKRQYANSNPVRLNPVSFEMIEEKLKKDKAWKKDNDFCTKKIDTRQQRTIQSSERRSRCDLQQDGSCLC